MNAKADTRLLVDDDDITVDASQHEIDLTAAETGAYEEASARTALDGTGEGRSLELVFQANEDSTGVLIDHGGATGAYRVQVNAGGQLVCSQGGVAILSMQLPGVSGVIGEFVLQWSTEPNAGAGAELRSEVTVRGPEFDVTRSTATHAATPASELANLSIGGVWSGASLGSEYSDTINAVRISARYHTSVELREDFVAQTAAPDVDGWLVAELPRLPGQLLERGEIAGPQYVVAAAAGEQHRPRLAGPLVQAMHRRPWMTLGADITDAYPPKWVVNLGGGWQVTAGWLWLLEVPRVCGWLLVTVQIAVWSTDISEVPGQVELRFTTSDARPGADGASATKTLTRDSEDGEEGGGALLSFERCFVVRDAKGLTWAWLAMRITGATAATTAYQIRQCTIVPMSVPSAELPEEPGDIFSP